MCGFVGFVNYKKDLTKEKPILEKMNNTISKRGPDEQGYYIKNHVAMAHKRLIVISPEGGKQPMIETYSFGEYVMVYNGQIYNTEELKITLKESGFTFSSNSDTEVLLKSYIHFGDDVVNHLNGIFAFAIWDEKNKSLFMARDHFGVKPLFYTIYNNNLIFASEVKAILKFPGITPVLDKQGISEMFGIGPAHTNGITSFKNIYELKPANYMIYNESGIHLKRYWKLKSKPHEDDFEQTCEKVQYLLEDSIKRQLVSDVPLCTFLSGGLD